MDISNQTARETGSMHIITILTLVFLPGTFVSVRTAQRPHHFCCPNANATAEDFFSKRCS